MKTYRAIRHDVVRGRQKINCPTVHHPEEKKIQVMDFLGVKSGLKILELFAGEGNLTSVYKDYGDVLALDKKLGTGDSFKHYHRLIADGKKYDVIDVDSYGFPSRFFPDIFLLMNDGIMFLTLPIASINILHDITKTHLVAYYGDPSPSVETMLEKIVLWGLCHWRQVQVRECIKIDRLYRAVLSVKRIKATEYTGVRNR